MAVLGLVGWSHQAPPNQPFRVRKEERERERESERERREGLGKNGKDWKMMNEMNEYGVGKSSKQVNR